MFSVPTPTYTRPDDEHLHRSTGPPAPRCLIVMGVSGSGKTTVAVRVAERLGWSFLEGDTLHPQANIDKMSAGVPLDDIDREPWLHAIVQRVVHDGADTVLTCSALKVRYRDRLREAGDVRFVHLDVDPTTLGTRLATRAGHFMPGTLLDTQLAALEPLRDDEPGAIVDGTLSIVEACEAVLRLTRDWWGVPAGS